MTMSASLRAVTVAEVGQSHALYREVVDWLKARGIRQWLRPLTVEEFTERQARGELFAGFLDGRMTAVVSLAFEADSDWRAHLTDEKRWWIKTLAVARSQGGGGLGKQIVARCEAFVRESGGRELYLECVDGGHLPAYYARLGYEVLKRAEITYPSGNTFLVALMRKSLQPAHPGTLRRP